MGSDCVSRVLQLRKLPPAGASLRFLLKREICSKLTIWAAHRCKESRERSKREVSLPLIVGSTKLVKLTSTLRRFFMMFQRSFWAQTGLLLNNVHEGLLPGAKLLLALSGTLKEILFLFKTKNLKNILWNFHASLLVWPVSVLVTINATRHLACDPQPSGGDTQTQIPVRTKLFALIDLHVRVELCTSPWNGCIRKNIILGRWGLLLVANSSQDAEMDAIRCEILASLGNSSTCQILIPHPATIS